MKHASDMLRRIASRLLVAITWIVVSLLFVWSLGAVYYLTFLPLVVRIALSLGYLAAASVVFVRVKKKSTWLSIAAASVGIVYLVTLFQRPSNDRDWDAGQEKMAQVVVSGEEITIKNFRHCLYRSENDFDVQYSERRFTLSQLDSVWFLVQKFSPLEALAHTFLSFGVDSGQGMQFFSVSVEIRRQHGEVFSPMRGLYRQFELLYVVGDERDLIGSRTVMRPDDRVHMYRVNASAEEAQQLFLGIAERINQLGEEPEFYHTFLNNCTNAIVFHTYDLTPREINWLDPRIVLPGYSDRFAFSHGLIGLPEESFQQLKRRSRIDERARQVGLTGTFSSEIRQKSKRAK